MSNSPPSTKDIYMRIDYIALFFNVTEDEAPGASKEFDFKCARHGWTKSEALCVIPPAEGAVKLALSEVSASRKSFSLSVVMLFALSFGTVCFVG